MRTRARPTTKADETPEFKEFWEVVWKPHMNPNDGRGSARDEFFRHVDVYGADPQDIVDGAHWYIFTGGNQKRAQDGSLIQQHAASWLNKRPYEDGCEEWRRHKERLEARLQERENVVPIAQRAVLPENHFSKRWEKMKQNKESA